MNYDPDNAGHRAALALDIKATLAGLGFQQVDVPGAKEAVFARNSTRLPRVQIQDLHVDRGERGPAGGW